MEDTRVGNDWMEMESSRCGKELSLDVLHLSKLVLPLVNLWGVKAGIDDSGGRI